MLPDWYSIVLCSFSAYIAACVIGVSSLFDPVRVAIIKKYPKLRIGNNKHFVECRLCLSFWTSLFFVILFGLSLMYVIPVYGMAYFLATQER